MFSALSGRIYFLMAPQLDHPGVHHTSQDNGNIILINNIIREQSLIMAGRGLEGKFKIFNKIDVW